MNGSAKATNSRSINTIGRQMSKQQIVAASSSGLTATVGNSSNRNNAAAGGQIVFINSQAKTPLNGAAHHLSSSGLTTESQKNLHISSQPVTGSN